MFYIEKYFVKQFLSLFILGVFISTEGTFGKLDIIINNAGIMDAIEWKKTLNINVVSC